MPLAIEGWRAEGDAMRDAVADSLYRSVLAVGAKGAMQRWRAQRGSTRLAAARGRRHDQRGGLFPIAHPRRADARELFGLEVEAWPELAQGLREEAISHLERAVAIKCGATRRSRSSGG